LLDDPQAWRPIYQPAQQPPRLPGLLQEQVG
jgi:hypothetical protein